MPDKKTDSAQTPKVLRKATNLNLNQVIKGRGLNVLRELGFELSEGVEKFLELLHEERVKHGRKLKQDHLQLTLFDRLTAPEPRAKKERK